MLSAFKRLQKENQQLKISHDDKTIILKPKTENLMIWEATIQGPDGSHYAGYYFDLNIIVPPEYPIVPPKISFKSKIFHPNVLFDV